jgi:hypothetical protein
MKTDLFTKVVLTVIASCLVYFVAKDLSIVQVAHAQSGQTIDVNIVQVAGAKISNNGMVSYDAYLPVKAK